MSYEITEGRSIRIWSRIHRPGYGALCVILSICAVLFPSFLHAQQSQLPIHRYIAVKQALDIFEPRSRALTVPQPVAVPQTKETEKTPKENAMEHAMRSLNIELTMEYFYGWGDQTFEIIDEVTGATITRVVYPQRGGALIFNGECRFAKRYGVWARFFSSGFKKTTCTDTQWQPSTSPDVWWQTDSATKPDLSRYTLNFYYRLFDVENPRYDRSINKSLNIENIDRVSLDVFGGYTHQKGHFDMSDGNDSVEWWAPTSVPLNNLNSYYETEYKGPLCGMRGVALINKWIELRGSVALARLTTNAEGWWNLQSYSFAQHNRGKGFGQDYSVDVNFHFHPSWFVGFGYQYSSFKQSKLSESGNNNGVTYDNLDIVRNVDNELYGPSFRLGYSW